MSCLYFAFLKVAELPVPTESRKTQLPPVSDHSVPDELLVSLTSTFCSRSTAGHTAHHRHCKVATSSHVDVYLFIVLLCVFENCSHCVFLVFFFVCLLIFYVGLGHQAARRSMASPTQTQEIPVLFRKPDGVKWSRQVRLD